MTNPQPTVYDTPDPGS